MDTARQVCRLPCGVIYAPSVLIAPPPTPAHVTELLLAVSKLRIMTSLCMPQGYSEDDVRPDALSGGTVTGA